MRLHRREYRPSYFVYMLLKPLWFSYRRVLSRFSDAIRSPDTEAIAKGNTNTDVTTPAPMTHKIPILGFSATFSRHDGLALGSVFEQIVYHQDFLQMIKDQWCVQTPRCMRRVLILRRLCNVRFTSVRANIDLTNVTVSAKTGDFNATSLSQVINTPTANKLVVQTWMDRCGGSLVLSAPQELTSRIASYAEVDSCLLRQSRTCERLDGDVPRGWR